MLLFTPIQSVFPVVILVIISCLAEHGPCFVDGMQISADAYANKYEMGFQDFVIVDSEWRFGTLCVSSHLLSIYSMLPAISSLKQKPNNAASRSSGSEFGVVQPLGSMRNAVEWMSYLSLITDQSMFKVSKGTTLSSPLSSQEGANKFSYTHHDGAVKSCVYSCKGQVVDQKIKETLKTRNTDVIKVVPFAGSSLNGPTSLLHCFEKAESTVTNMYLYTHTASYLGKLFLHNSGPSAWKCSFLIRSNLSDMQGPIFGYSWSRYQELYAKIIENLTAEVRNVGKKACLLGELIVHTSTGLASDSGEPVKLLVSSETDSFATSTHNNIEFPLVADVLETPMKACLSCVINLSRKSVLLVQMNKCCVIPLLAAFLLLLIFCCLFCLPEPVRSEDCLYKNTSEMTSCAKKLEKPSHVCRNMKNNKTSLSSGEIRILRQESVCKNPDNSMGWHKLNSLYENGDVSEDNYIGNISVYSPQLPIAIAKIGTLGTSATVEKTSRKKDRKKHQDKKTGAAAGSTEFLKGSYTNGRKCNPSPPTTPVATLLSAPSYSLSPEADESKETKNSFSQVVEQHKRKSQVPVHLSQAKILDSSVSIKSHSTSLPTPIEHSLPRKTYSRTLMLSFSASHFAGRHASDLVWCSPIVASRCTVSLFERAPGSNLSKQTKVKTEETTKLGDIFTYDIWDDHWSRLCLMRKPTDVFIGSGSHSNSFFVRGPLVLFR